MADNVCSPGWNSFWTGSKRVCFMASISDMSWISAEDLFNDLDLDRLYLRQMQTMGAESWTHYPYMILVHTGKISLLIELGRPCDLSEWSAGIGLDKVFDSAAMVQATPHKDPPE
jgi:hypothetical protein